MEIKSIENVKNGKEISGSVETNHLGQVKIVSTDKTRKWIWVNVKKYRGILSRRLACLKWEQGQRQRKRKLCQRKKINKRSKNKKESTIYSPTSTPLIWPLDLYVEELMRARTRLGILEAKEQERDHKISEITISNQCLMEGNIILK